MIVIDSKEPDKVKEAFEEKGVPYITAEIRFYHCKDCKHVDFKAFKECVECGSTNIKSKEAGDFTNTNRTFLVERKTPEDFVGSMLDYSLQDQARRMAKYFAGWKFVFLEGFIDEMVINPYNKNIIPWIKSMRLTLRQFNICMWQMDDIYMLIDELVRLDKMAGTEPKIRDKISDKYKGWSHKKKIVCKLIDVSDKKADILLEKLKSPILIFNAIVDSELTYTRTGNIKGVKGAFENVKGFGPKFIQKNKNMLLGLEDEKDN